MDFASTFVTALLELRDSYAAYLRLYCGNIDDYISTELEEPLPLLASKCFNKDLKTLVYAFGFTSSPKADTTETVVEAYMKIGGYNVFVVDWEEEAASPSLIMDVVKYPASAVPNTIRIGEQCGQALDQMSASTLNLSTTHLIGHSLGAHLVGYCGKELQTFNKNVSRITGLDPAGPLFDGPLSLDGLNPSRAEFVDVLHTDPGVYGTKEQLGQVDIWFNCACKNQPQCAIESIIIAKDSCNHQDVCYYMAEALLNSTAFVAQQCDSCHDWVTLNATPETDSIIYIGEDTDRTARGNFYLKTSSEPPYGMGAEGLTYIYGQRDE
ncbi:lipase member H-like [Aricia agestis]|uniref:lipase member H-like n=1 Tax=Aricia agestis TaxID=91739 RepID=UPI001C20B405|nr:lipase member H-like [Aricia agestis]